MMHQYRRGSPGRPRPRAALLALALATAGASACSEPITAPEPAAQPSAQPSFAAGGLTVTSARVLQQLAGATSQSGSAVDVNGLGQVVGTSGSPAGVVSVVWNAAGAPTQLPPLAAGQFAYANAISEDGTIVVGYASDGITFRATRWVRSGAGWIADALPPQNGFDYCFANETSADGSLIVGYCSSGSFTAAIAWRSGFPLTLGAGIAWSVNDAGEIAGTSGNDQGVIWTLPSGSQNIGTLGGLSTAAYAINEKGGVVGFSNLPNNAGYHAFLWTERREMVDLGALGGAYSLALDVNDANQAVGYLWSDDGGAFLVQHAALWARGKTLDLGVPLGSIGSEANAITNSGMIVGTIFSQGGGNQAVVWQLR